MLSARTFDYNAPLCIEKRHKKMRSPWCPNAKEKAERAVVLGRRLISCKMYKNPSLEVALGRADLHSFGRTLGQPYGLPWLDDSVILWLRLDIFEEFILGTWSLEIFWMLLGDQSNELFPLGAVSPFPERAAWQQLRHYSLTTVLVHFKIYSLPPSLPQVSAHSQGRITTSFPGEITLYLIDLQDSEKWIWSCWLRTGNAVGWFDGDNLQTRIIHF